MSPPSPCSLLNSYTISRNTSLYTGSWHSCLPNRGDTTCRYFCSLSSLTAKECWDVTQVLQEIGHTIENMLCTNIKGQPGMCSADASCSETICNEKMCSGKGKCILEGTGGNRTLACICQPLWAGQHCQLDLQNHITHPIDPFILAHKQSSIREAKKISTISPVLKEEDKSQYRLFGSKQSAADIAITAICMAALVAFLAVFATCLIRKAKRKRQCNQKGNLSKEQPKPSTNGGGTKPRQQINVLHPAVTLKGKRSLSAISQYADHPLMRPAWTKWRAKFAYDPQRDDEMALQAGDEVYCICIYDDCWASGVNLRTGSEGQHLPLNFCTPCEIVPEGTPDAHIVQLPTVQSVNGNLYIQDAREAVPLEIRDRMEARMATGQFLTGAQRATLKSLEKHSTR